jgi:dTDP-4-dehydrorhamnose 3,5-epimerase
VEIQTFEIQGPLLIQLKCFTDDRGFFVERFNEEKFKAAGLPYKFVQDNFSRSKHRVLRGLHYQLSPPQGKLVSCTRGSIFDVAVDIRKTSSTFGKHVSVELHGDSPALFWIPAGFAHGFCVTSNEGADVSYKVDNPWSPTTEGCVDWASTEINIQWPIANPILSDKDRIGKQLKSI